MGGAIVNKSLKSTNVIPHDSQCGYCKHTITKGSEYWYHTQHWDLYCSKACSSGGLYRLANPPPKRVATKSLVPAVIGDDCHDCQHTIRVGDDFWYHGPGAIYCSKVCAEHSIAKHHTKSSSSPSTTKPSVWSLESVKVVGFNCNRCKLYVPVKGQYYTDLSWQEPDMCVACYTTYVISKKVAGCGTACNGTCVKCSKSSAKTPKWVLTLCLVPNSKCEVCSNPVLLRQACYYKNAGVFRHESCHKRTAIAAQWVKVTAIYRFPCNLCGKAIIQGDEYEVQQSTSTARCIGCKGTNQVSTKKRFEQTINGLANSYPCAQCRSTVQSGTRYWYDTKVVTGMVFCSEACAQAYNGCFTNPIPAIQPSSSKSTNVTLSANAVCVQCLGQILCGSTAWVDKSGEATCIQCEHSNSLQNGGVAPQPTQTMGQTVMAWQNYTITKGATCGDCGTRIGRGQAGYRKQSSHGPQFRCLQCKPGVLGAPNKLYDGVIGTGQTALQPTIKCVDLGTAPTKEQVACFGGRHYDERVQRELDIWEPWLVNKFGQPPRGATFARKVKKHAAGSEITLWLDFDENVDAARKYANDLVTNMPEYYHAPAAGATQSAQQQQAQAAAPTGIVVDTAGKQWQALTKNSDLKARPCAGCGTRPKKGDNYFDGGKGKGNLRCGNCPPT